MDVNIAEMVLVDDVLRGIFRMLLNEEVKYAASFCGVNKRWNSIGSESSLWKDYVLSKWPLLATSKKIKNWKLVARRRTENSTVSIIENCSESDISYKDFELKWKFKCPLKWVDLSNLNKLNERHCESCDKSVFLCESVEELTHHVRSGHCVAFRPVGVARRFGSEVAKIPVIDISGSGKSIWLSHFQHKPEAISSVYVTEPYWKEKSEATICWTVGTSIHWEFHFTQFGENDQLEFYHPFIVLITTESNSNTLALTERLQRQYSAGVFRITNKPNAVETKQVATYHVETDCNSSKLSEYAFQFIAGAYYEAFSTRDEDMGFGLFD